MDDIPLGPAPRDHVGTKKPRVAHAPGICRICRCEGTVEEPLYYPCRCSGSIQHVHQDCLMQWLSHSQKRYCELCMTPYRFTKFYNPNMPTSLPLSVFLEKSARYALANSLSWLRAGVAIGFWLIALPFFMRRGWSYMFWLSRESWTNNRSSLPFLHGNNWGDSIHLSSTTLGLDTCPASPLFHPTTTPAKTLAENMRISAQGQGQTLSGSLLQGLYWTMGWKDGPTPPKSDSLLSNVKFFKGNETLIDVMEGQIITVVVIVSFILIILVRDYVVQQQPELNVREGAERDQQAGEQAPVAVQPAHIADASDSEEEGEEEDAQHEPLLEHEQPPRADSPLPGDWTSDAAENTPGTTSSGFGSDVADYNGSDVANLTPSDRSNSPTAFDAHPFEDPAAQGLTGSLLQPDAGPSRQRSVSDGAQINTSVNPLANNTWSFDAAPAVNQGTSNSDDPAGSHDHEAPLRGFQDQQPAAVNVDANRDSPVPEHDHAARPVETTGQEAEQLESQTPQNTAGGITGFMYGDIEGRYQEIAAQPQAVADDGDHAVDWEDGPMDGEGDLPGPLPGQAHDEGLENPAVAVAQDNEADDDGVLDVEAIEDMEDFEGIMDLLGMRGPITNLFQNVIFCSVLVQSALTLCVFIPFNVGRVFFWFIDRPDRLLRILYEVSKVAQDVTFIFAGAISWVATNLVDMITERIGGALAAQVVHARKASFELAIASGKRVGHFLDLFLTDVFATGTAMQQWSATSHGSLINIKGRVGLFFTVLRQLFGGKSESPRETFDSLLSNTSSLSEWSTVDTTGLVDPKLAFWPSADITLAVFAGYFFIIIAAALYVKSGIRFTRGSALEEWENGFVDTLHQASGIFKVITIISIEMLVFPLYCGLLLDCALLPLFNGASLTSRLLFTRNNPWTSVFVHWFVGTGYMFHFALFVSMCRKIMRPGVLYFIRDPDDPDFHPVRDVLDRNLATQLRKIMFSAFVYGALVIVCLGGVVWGLALAAPPVLPIHYSSNEPILEFPLDLLFYNFFMPFSLKLLKPDENLLVLFKWCFRKSARMLRLTYFLFGQRRLAEEGTLRSPKYADGSMEGWLFLDLGRKQDRVKDKSWRDLFDGIDSERVYNPTRRGMRKKEIRRLNATKAKLVEEGSLVPDGRFVRAPATDRIKIPKGTDVFLTVNEENDRQDGKTSEDIYSSPHFKMTYIPPNFLRRIFAFILLIWTFAAIIGVGATIIPLILGRFLFKMALPEHVRTNDVYAFCIGFHIFGYGLYALDAAWKSRSDWNVAGWMTEKLKGISSTAAFMRAAKMVYAYTFILVVCPLAIAVLVELYINLPLHSVLHPPGKADATAGKSQHHVRIIELWTMGLLYMRLLVKLSHSFLRNTRFNLAREGILIQGWLNPNIKLLTRAFVTPGLPLALIAVLGPPRLVAILERYGFFPVAVGNNPELVAERILRYRHAYPVVAFFTISAKYGTLLRHSFDSLKAQVRDDTYLMGERLQNYDGSPAQASAGTQTTAAE